MSDISDTAIEPTVETPAVVADAPVPDVQVAETPPTNKYDKIIADTAPVAAPAAPVNKYDAVHQEITAERTTKVRATVLTAGPGSPDAAGKAVALARKTGMPADLVERNLPEIEQTEKLNKYDEVLKRSPKMADWLAQDPINVKVADAPGDVEKLGFLEWTVNELYRPYLGMQASSGLAGMKVAARKVTQLDAAEAKSAAGEYMSPFEKQMLAQAPQIRDEMRGYMIQYGTQRQDRMEAAAALPELPAIKEMQKAGEAGDWGGVFSALMKDPVRAAYAISLQGAAMLPFQIGGAMVAGPVGVFGVSFGLEYMGAVEEAIKAAGVNTQDPAALMQALGNAELMAKVEKQAATKASVIGAFDSASMGVAGKAIGVGRKAVTKHATNIVAQIGVQGAMGGAGEALGSLAADLPVDPFAVVSEVVGEMGGAPAEVAGVRSWQNAIRQDATAEQWAKFQALPPAEQQATGQAMLLDKLVAQANDTKLAKTSPEKLQEFMASVSGQDATVFVPAEAVNAYMQDMTGLQSQAFLSSLGVTADQIARIRQTDEDFAIPLAMYITGASEAHAAWRDQVRKDVDGFSIKQAQEWAKAKDEQIAALQAKFEEHVAAGLPPEPQAVVYQQVLEMAKANGYTSDVASQHAALYAARYAARAARNPEMYADALDAFEKAGAGKGLQIQTMLADGTRAAGPDVLDTMLDSLRSGKDPVRVPRAARGGKPAGPAVDATILKAASRLARGWTPEKTIPAPQSLTDFVRKNGGLRIGTSEAGDIRAADLGKIPGLLQLQGKGKGRQAGMAQVAVDKGRQADQMAQAAYDAGFRFGKDTGIGSGIDVAAFMAALEADATGRSKAYPDDAETAAFQAQQEYFDEFFRWLKDDLGWEPKGRTPEEVAKFLSQDDTTQRLMVLAERVEALGPDSDEARQLDRELARIADESLERLADEFADRDAAMAVDETGAAVDTDGLSTEEWEALHDEIAATVSDDAAPDGRPADGQVAGKRAEGTGRDKAGDVAAGKTPKEAARSRREAALARFHGDRRQLADVLDSLGLDIAKMSNAQVRAVLEKETKGRTLEQIPPDAVRSLKYESKMPTDPLFAEAVANTEGASITADGLLINLVRHQKPEQGGALSVRTGVFYLPAGSPDARHYKKGASGYGGTDKVEGETLLRAPLFIKGATGGKAPEAAYDSIKGKGAYAAMRTDVLSSALGRMGGRPDTSKIWSVLEKYGADGNLAGEIADNSTQGNTLSYAIQENIVAHAIRAAGYDSVVGWTKKKGNPTISEVFDVREETYPTPDGDFSVLNEFYQSGVGRTYNQPVYHGGPHIFDRFSLDHIGSGEGAQAYGWGLYMAGSKAVAKYYRESLTGGERGGLALAGVVPSTADEGLSNRSWMATKELSELLVSNTEVGQPFGGLDVVGQARVLAVVSTLVEDRKIFDAVVRLLPVDVVNVLGGEKASTERGLDNLSVLIDLFPVNADDPVSSRIEAMNVLASAVALAAAKIHTGLARFDVSPRDFLTAGGALGHDVPQSVTSKIPRPSEFIKGRLYHVEIPEDGAYLLWDKPLSEQPEGVKAALEQFGLKYDQAAADSYDDALLAALNDNGSGDLPKRQNNPTGDAIYRRISVRTEGGDKAASEALRAAGVAGIKYLDGSSRGQGDGTHNYVLFDDSLAKITQYEQAARGSITFGDNATIIQLFQARDLSTLAHESGHMWLEELGFDAKSATASAAIKADWQTVLDFVGSTDGYITRDQHELFARGFETYLMEGKAPSEGLRSVFRQFKNWLVSIYRNLTKLQAPLSPEMRQVFDRLVATDEEIANAQNAQALNPVFADAKSAGMTETEFAAYTRRATQVVDVAEQAVLEKVMASIRRERTKEVAAEKAKIRGEVTDELMAEPGQAALHLLRTGKLFAGETPEVLVDAKLDRNSLVEILGEAGLANMPAGSYVAEGGVDVDTLATMIGLGNGVELVERLMQIQAEQAAMRAKGDNRSVASARIAEETQRRLTDSLGDPLTDGSIEAEAMAAIHSDKQGALMSTELKVLARKAGQAGAITLDDIQSWAESTIAEMSVYQGTQAAKYQRAERMAGQKVQRALIKGDFVAAFKAKQDQLVNFALYQEAKKAASDVEGIRKLADRYASAATIKSMEQSSLEQIHQVLEDYDFKKRGGALLAERTTFSTWAAEQIAAGFEVIEPPRLKGATSKHFSQMTVEEIRGVGDTIKQIAHIGRWKQEMLDDGKKRDFAALVDEAVATAAAAPQRGVSQLRRGTTNLQDTLGDSKSWFKSVDSALLKMETLFEWLDNDKTGRGVFSRVVFRRVADAQVLERDMQKDLADRQKAIFDKVPAAQSRLWSQQHTVDLPGTKQLNKSQMLAVALNMGNESNKAKLLEGEKWAEADVQAMLDKNLTAEEWRFVQDTWDLIQTLWPASEALEKRVNGVAPPKVEAVPVVTPSGTLRGGYYPMAYDKAGDVKADRIASKSAEGLFDLEYKRATTRAGSTHARVEGFNAKVHLSLSVIGAHYNEMAHDISHREAVMDINKFLSNDKVRDAIRGAVGPEYEKQTLVWLKAVANEWAIDKRGLEGVDRFLQAARANTAIVGMGFRVSTMLSQTAGFANSIQRLGSANMLRGMRDFYRNPFAMAEAVRGKSGEMRHRANDLERDIRLALKRMEGKDSSLDSVRRFAFRGIALFDAAVSLPTWMGAYNDALRQGMSEADAVRYGDKMVRDTQGAGSVKDLSAFQRGSEPMKILGMFYSYFNVYYNRQRGLVRDFRSADSFSDYMNVVAEAMWLMVIPTLLAAMLSGQGPDDDEDWWKWASRQVGFGVFSGIPWARDVANATSNLVGGKNFGGAKLSPIEGIGEGVIHLFKDGAALAQGKETSKTAIKNVFNLVGLGIALPLGQVGASSQFVWDALVEGTQDPEGLLDWMKGLAYGPKHKK